MFDSSHEVSENANRHLAVLPLYSLKQALGNWYNFEEILADVAEGLQSEALTTSNLSIARGECDIRLQHLRKHTIYLPM